MGLTRIAIKRPVTMLMIILGLVLMGIVSYTLLPIQQLPNVSFPFVVVVVDFPGANPQDMYQSVTQPLENAISAVSGIQEIDGLSADGLSRVAVRFTTGTDVSTAANEIAQEVNRVQGRLPAGIQPPTILQANPNAFPIMDVAITGNLPRTQLYNLVSNVVEPDIQQVAGVGAVNVNSGITPQVNVTVDPKLAAAYGVSLEQIDSAIASQNVSTPGGNTTIGGLTTTTRTAAYFQSAQQLENLVVATRSTGYITLAQVADVQQGTAPVTMQSLFNGRQAMGLTLTAQSGANLVAVDKAVRGEIARLSRSLPAGVAMHIVNDETNYIYSSMRAVEDDLAMAVLLPALVLLLFLHRPRNMLIVLLAIPTSLISTFILMYAFGFSLDLISLLALSLMTGILVDDSIVVLENINRHLSLGKNPIRAAIDGRSEIGQAAIAITMTDVVVYLPIAFTSGIVGQIFREFGLTIVVATLFSLFVSFTLTPLLAARWLQEPVDEYALGDRPPRGLWNRFSAWFERGWVHLRDRYGRLIRLALRRRFLVVCVGVCALAASVAFIPLGWVGTEFVPQDDYGLFNVNIQLPVGTALPVTESVIDGIDKQIRALPGVVDTTLTAGAHGGFFGGANTNTGRIFVDLKPVGQRAPLPWYLQRVRALGHKFPGASVITFVPSALRIGGQRAVGVVLQGPNIGTLTQQANRLTAVMKALPGVVGVRDEGAQAQPEFAVSISRRMAAYFGVTAQSIGQTIQTAIAGTTASYLRPTGQTNETPIVVSVKGGDHLTAQQIEDLPLTVSGSSSSGSAPKTYAQAEAVQSGSVSGGQGGGQSSAPTVITLGTVATVKPSFAPAQLNDVNRQLQVTVDASTSGVPQGQIAQEISAAMAKFGLPPGYNWTFTGAVQQQQRVFGPLFAAFALSVLLVYMLTSALYESLIYPLAVLLSLPLATVGAFAGLAVTGNTLNLYSFMGLIMLMGLVAKNAILLVDYTNTLRRRGYAVLDALVESGRTRLRPILMTTATMVCAMLPLALKIGSGSEDRSPMATVLIGGLITSTMLTLIFVPAMYSYLEDLAGWLTRHGLARPQRFDPEPEDLDGGPAGVAVSAED